MKYKTIYLDPPWKICTGGTSKRKKTGIEHKGWGTPQNPRRPNRVQKHKRQ